MQIKAAEKTFLLSPFYFTKGGLLKFLSAFVIVKYFGET